VFGTATIVHSFLSLPFVIPLSLSLSDMFFGANMTSGGNSVDFYPESQLN